MNDVCTVTKALLDGINSGSFAGPCVDCLHCRVIKPVKLTPKQEQLLKDFAADDM